MNLEIMNELSEIFNSIYNRVGLKKKDWNKSFQPFPLLNPHNFYFKYLKGLLRPYILILDTNLYYLF